MDYTNPKCHPPGRLLSNAVSSQHMFKGAGSASYSIC